MSLTNGSPYSVVGRSHLGNLGLKLVQDEHAKADGDEGDAGSIYQVENTGPLRSVGGGAHPGLRRIVLGRRPGLARKYADGVPLLSVQILTAKRNREAQR